MQLQVTVSSLGDDLDAQKNLVSDLRKRVSETATRLNNERRRVEDITVKRDEEHAEASHTIELLHEKLDHSKSHLDSCKDEHADTQGTKEHMQRVRCILCFYSLLTST